MIRFGSQVRRNTAGPTNESRRFVLLELTFYRRMERYTWKWRFRGRDVEVHMSVGNTCTPLTYVSNLNPACFLAPVGHVRWSSSRSQPNSPSHACLESGMQYQVAREAVGSKSWETRCRGQDQQDKEAITSKHRTGLRWT